MAMHILTHSRPCLITEVLIQDMATLTLEDIHMEQVTAMVDMEVTVIQVATTEDWVMVVISADMGHR
jgi:hypothetical protein